MKLPRIELFRSESGTFYLSYLDESGAGPDIRGDYASHAEAMDEVAWWRDEEPEAHFVGRTDPMDRLPSPSRH